MRSAAIFLATLIIFGATSEAYSQKAKKPAGQSPEAKIEVFFKASGLQYRRPSADVWGVVRDGVQYFYAVEDGLFVAGVILATREGRSNSCELYETLLKLNHRFDYVKVLIDAEGDLAVRLETTVAGLDQKRFNDLLKQHHLATNNIFDEVRNIL
jgi:hypothetical protein